MRGLFGIIGLLLVLAIVGVLAKKQLGSLNTATVPVSAGVAPDATPQQQSQQIQQNVKQSVDAAMQQTRPMPDDTK